MRKHKRKHRISVARERVHHDAWRAEIVGDVFELWLGISRLMGRVREPERRREPDPSR
jgi:hypothetical protein